MYVAFFTFLAGGIWILVLALAFLALVVHGCFSMYNQLISLRAQVERAWANVDVVLKQRSHEVPAIISVLEQGAAIEAELCRQLYEARSRYVNSSDRSTAIQANIILGLATRRALRLREAYPTLGIHPGFRIVQERLSDLEEMISERRELYNQYVQIFNVRIREFPQILVAPFLGLRPFPFYKESK